MRRHGPSGFLRRAAGSAAQGLYRGLRSLAAVLVRVRKSSMARSAMPPTRHASRTGHEAGRAPVPCRASAGRGRLRRHEVAVLGERELAIAVFHRTGLELILHWTLSKSRT